MEKEKMNEKDWIVVEYFIRHESSLLNREKPFVKNPTIKKCKDNKEHFLAYAKKIHNDTHSMISNVWAKKVCQKMVNLGVLDYEMIRPPRQKNDTEHYYLRSDPSSFRKVIRFVIENMYPNLWYIFSQAYFQKNINESLIREILSEKKVEIRRCIDLWNWDPKEAKDIFKRYFSEYSGTSNLSFDKYIEEKLKGEYAKEQNHRFFSKSVSLRLPVLKEGINENGKLSHKQLNILEKLNEGEFKRNPWLRLQYSGIVDHYVNLQQEKWIIPMLALIKASPVALNEFLNGNWEIETVEGKCCICFSEDGLDSFKMIFFRILFKAISDIATTRRVPESIDVESAYLRPYSSFEIKEKDCLLQIILNPNIYVRFDAGFNTHHDYIGTEAGDVFELPDERYYWVKAWIDYSSYPFLGQTDIKNYGALIKKLMNNTSKIDKHIFEKFSNRMKNSLEHIDALPLLSEEFKTDLLIEINKLLLWCDLSKDITFISDSLSDHVRNKIIKYREYDPLLDAYLISEERIYLNRSILEDIFAEEISKHETRVWQEKFDEELETEKKRRRS
jgi:hypothetical protein